MSIDLPDRPFFLPPRTGDNSGVDFLGLRQTNLDMMADMIPSINNVTGFVRPFSLVCWVFWKFHDLCSKSGLLEPSREDIERFRERIEVLFSWGASMHQNGGRIPGTGAVPPAPSADGQYPLTFKDWKRVPSSTGLMAALWYGPASKTVTGLGFLSPVPGKSSFFQVAGLGVRLAEALDAQLRSEEDLYSRLLATLAHVTASRDDAVKLWQVWAPDQLLEAEKETFRSALFSQEEVGDLKSLRGKRSTTLALAIHHLGHCTAPASAVAIRQGMALSVAEDGLPYTIPETLVGARNGWLTLQMRQLQRLSMESLLSWCEECILADRITETAIMAERFSEGWDQAEPGFEGLSTVSEMIVLLDQQADSIQDFVAAVNEGRLSNPFQLMASIQGLFKRRDTSFAQRSFLGLLLCVTYARAGEKEASSLRRGGAPRLSLESLRRRMVALGDVTVREAFQYVLEAMIISQHFSTAVNRFDGQKQRLRLTIEETGLEALVGKPWEPTVTEDRLPTLLSLAAQAGLLTRSGDDAYSTKDMKAS